MDMHPAEEIRGEKTQKLAGKQIVVGITGSVAAVNTFHLCRELIRHGARVFPVMTSAATRILHPDALWFATGEEPITELTGATEHVAFCGEVSDHVDLLLIAPCTANTLSKIALGIDDTPVTTFATTAVGSNISVMIAPAMHASMYQHKSVMENLQRCKQQLGITIIGPHLVGNKAKVASIDEIITEVFRLIGKQDLVKQKILVIGGPTREAVDDIRILTNRSSGKTAVSLAQSAYERGADVELWYGGGQESVPSYISTRRFESINDVVELIEQSNIAEFTVILLCAALSDYIPEKHKGKIPSGKKSFSLQLSSAPKLIEQLKKKASSSAQIVAFKVEEKKDDVVDKASALMKSHDIDMVVGNTIQGFESDENDVWIIQKKGEPTRIIGKKRIIAEKILDHLKKIK